MGGGCNHHQTRVQSNGKPELLWSLVRASALGFCVPTQEFRLGAFRAYVYVRGELKLRGFPYGSLVTRGGEELMSKIYGAKTNV